MENFELVKDIKYGDILLNEYTVEEIKEMPEEVRESIAYDILDHIECAKNAPLEYF